MKEKWFKAERFKESFEIFKKNLTTNPFQKLLMLALEHE